MPKQIASYHDEAYTYVHEADTHHAATLDTNNRGKQASKQGTAEKISKVKNKNMPNFHEEVNCPKIFFFFVDLTGS